MKKDLSKALMPYPPCAPTLITVAPQLRQHDLLNEIAAVFFLPYIDQFDVELTTIFGDQRQGISFGLVAEMGEFAIKK